MKTKFLIGVLVIITIVIGLVFALPTNRGIDKAKGVSPAIDENGEIKAPPEFVAQLPESQLTKVVFIRYAPGFQKEKSCDYDGICDADERGWCSDCKGGEEPEEPTTACYGFLSGAKPKWNWIENYYYSDATLGTSSASAVSTWESATTGDIFGNGIAESNPWGIYDYKNSILYDDYPETGVIGVTAIWFRGKNIYEYDIMFDTDYFPGSIDLGTVVLHEFGHAAGLNDLYDVVCIDEVMYGIYKGVKTELKSGDTTGIQKLYG